MTAESKANFGSYSKIQILQPSSITHFFLHKKISQQNHKTHWNYGAERVLKFTLWLEIAGE